MILSIYGYCYTVIGKETPEGTINIIEYNKSGTFHTLPKNLNVSPDKHVSTVIYKDCSEITLIRIVFIPSSVVL